MESRTAVALSGAGLSEVPTAGAGSGIAADPEGPDLPSGSYRGARAFGFSMAALLAVVLAATLIPGLSDYSLPVMALAFLAAGL
ncbi:hypothetical protein RZS08_03995, partial [Arthrospira platensis SPKY1]|nr:hypothetical protein [Arthrospira platensis SPKY1]